MISKWMRRVSLAAVVAGTVAVAGASTAEAGNNRYGTRYGNRGYYGNTVRSYRPIVVNPGYNYGYYPRAGVSVGVGPSYGYGYSNFNRPYSSYYSPYSSFNRSIPWGGYGVGGYPPGASWGGGGINLRIGR